MENPNDAAQYIDQGIEVARLAQRTGILQRLVGWLPNLGHRDPTVDYEAQGLKVLRENALDYLRTLELTTADASRILAPGFTLDDLDKVDPTWQKHWVNKVSNVDVDDDERRSWWARLLAGEIEQPGRFSLRTLAVMDTLSTEEARDFTDYCRYVWTSLCIGNVRAGIPGNKIGTALAALEWELRTPHLVTLKSPTSLPSNTLRLESAGLLLYSDAGFGIAGDSAGPTPTHPCGFAVMRYGDRRFAVWDHDDGPKRIHTGRVLLTSVGKELYSLVDLDTLSGDYCDAVIDMWKTTHRVVELWL